MANPFALLAMDSDEEGAAPAPVAPKATVAPPKVTNTKAADAKKVDAKPAPKDAKDSRPKSSVQSKNSNAESAPAKEASDPDTRGDTRSRDANKRGGRGGSAGGERGPRPPRGDRPPRDANSENKRYNDADKPRGGDRSEEKPKMDRHSRKGPADQKGAKRGGEGVGNWGNAKDTEVISSEEVAAVDAPVEEVAAPEPEVPAVKEFSYQEFMENKKAKASLPALPTLRKAGEGDKISQLPVGTQTLVKKQAEETVTVSERKTRTTEVVGKFEDLKMGTKSYFETREPSSPSPRGGDRGARGGRGGSRGGSSRGGSSGGRGGSSPGFTFNPVADFPEMKAK